MNRFRSIYNNINPKSSTYNKTLLRKLKNKKFKTTKISFYDSSRNESKIMERISRCKN